MSDEPVVPGEFACPQCGFVVTKRILHAQSGGVSADTRDVLDTCPNDGTILRPVNMLDALNEARKMACENAMKLRKCEEAMSKAREC